MPSGARIRANSVFGTVSDNPLSPGATTFNSNQLVLLPVVIGNHAIITLDPLRLYGDPEIVIVTAHSAASTVATIQRGAYGTSAREHPSTTVWVHALIDEDCIEILTSASRPSDPYRGQMIFETDTNRFVGRSTTDVWQQLGFFFDPPFCSVTRTAALSHTSNGAFQTFGFDTEIQDILNMHDNVTNNSRITVPTAGLYLVTGGVLFSGNATGIRAVGIRKNGGGVTPNVPGRAQQSVVAAQDQGQYVSTVINLAANDFIEITAFQNAAASLAYSVSATEFYNFFTVVWIGRGN